MSFLHEIDEKAMDIPDNMTRHKRNKCEGKIEYLDLIRKELKSVRRENTNVTREQFVL